MHASKWIDRVKAAKGWESDYRAAKELGISQTAISNIRARADATLSEETAIKVAEALGIAPASVVLDQLAQRTKSEPLRSTIAQLCILC